MATDLVRDVAATTEPSIVMRLFVSSPPDVSQERARVAVVAARLNAELEGLAEIEVIRWENDFYSADRSFQEAIKAAVDQVGRTDMVVCILWKRVGSELDPRIWRRPDRSLYESSTVFEFETALALSRAAGAPDVYLFRKSAPIAYASETYRSEAAQHQLLEAVWRRWTASEDGHNVAGYQRFADADEFERQFEQCLRQWLERKGIVRRAVWDRRVKGSPFRGLAAFEAEHAAVFFGREAAVERALAKLREAEAAGTAAVPRAPFLLVIGASGAGKSSLLRAGLIPRILQPGTVTGIDLWRSALVVPGGDPLASLADAVFGEAALGGELAAGDFPTPAGLADCLAAGGDAALAPIAAALDRAAQERSAALAYDQPRPARLLLAVDQVERLFVEAEPARVAAFAELLRALAGRRLATIIIALRGDAYGRFQQVPGFAALVEEMQGATYNLLLPSIAELEDIVAKPVAACDPPLAFETDGGGRSLAERLVADAKGGEAVPLLQVTLGRLYDAEAGRGDGILRFADYPGLDAAVAQTAGEVLAAVGSEARAELPALLAAFVADIGEDFAGGRQPVIVPINRAAFERGRAARKALVDGFIAHRLITANDAGGREQIRPVHDALLRAWPEAMRILADSAALIHVRHTLEPMAADWDKAEAAAKPSHLATSETLLVGAERLLAAFAEDLTPAMRGFIAASLAADQARRDAERRRQRWVLTLTLAGLVVALILSALALWQWRVTATERARAEHSLNPASALPLPLPDQESGRGRPASSSATKVNSAAVTLTRAPRPWRNTHTSTPSVIELRPVFRMSV